jgi:hypothetical protein
MILGISLPCMTSMLPALADESLPPGGRSLFDILTTAQTPEGPRLKVPFPFDKLRTLIKTKGHLSDENLAETLVPIGRSLQREAAAPDYFRSPRRVLGVTGAPTSSRGGAPLILKNRLYLGYQPKSEVLEVISYNEGAGRFEFQIVENYAHGKKSRTVQARRPLCLSCHRNGGPIFSNPPWSETPANPEIAARLAMVAATPFPNSGSIEANRRSAADLHRSVGAANRLLHASKYWAGACIAPNTARYCKVSLLSTALEHRLSGRRSFGQGDFLSRRETEDFLEESQRFAWPDGFKIASPFIDDVDPFSLDTNDAHGSADPLVEVPPSRVLDVADADGNNQIIDLLGDVFTEVDIRWLDRTLSTVAESVGAPRRVAGVPCVVQPVSPSDTKNMTFICDGGVPGFPKMNGRIVRAGGEAPEILIDKLSIELLAYHDLEAEVMATSRDLSGIRTLRLRPIDPTTGLQPRTGDGWVVASLEWPLPDSPRQGYRAVFTIRDDIKRFRVTASTLSGYRLVGAERAITDGGIRGPEIMKALAIRLGQPAPDWCCDPPPNLPPATMSAEAAGLTIPGLSTVPGPAHPSLQAFHRVCGACHAGRGAAPPNFLHGSSERQIEAIADCAPRILERLSQWRSKTRRLPPMPPPSYLTGIGGTAEEWMASTDYRRIQRLAAVIGGDAAAEAIREGRVLPACAPIGD